MSDLSDDKEKAENARLFSGDLLDGFGQRRNDLLSFTLPSFFCALAAIGTLESSVRNGLAAFWTLHPRTSLTDLIISQTFHLSDMIHTHLLFKISLPKQSQ